MTTPIVDATSAFATDDSPIICVRDGEVILAYIVRASFAPGRTTFVTPDELTQQLGFVVYAAGKVIPRHAHLKVKRTIDSTSEVILVRQGRCVADIYNDVREEVASIELGRGDIIALAGGGHRFRVLEDVVLAEIKQGPYNGLPEKELF